MSYGRETVGNALRKAGQALTNFDEGYSDRIADMYLKNDEDNQVKQLAAMFGGGTPMNYQESIDGFANKAKVSSAVSKYVLPAAGVTLAGKGLIDIAGAIGQQTTSTLEPTGYDYIENVPKERTIKGSPEGELLVAGMRGFGMYKEYDPVILGSRVNDLQEQMGYPPVRATGYGVEVEQ